MSAHAAKPAHTVGHHRAEEAHHPGPVTYIVIAIVLTILTAFEIGVFYAPFLQAILVPLLIILAICKFYLVAAYYMHLHFDSRVFTALFMFPLWLAMLIVASLMLLFLYLSHHLVPWAPKRPGAVSREYLYMGKLSFAESVNFLIPSRGPFLFRSLTPFRCVHVADSLARSFPIPLPVQGEGKRAWRARVRAASTYDVGRLVDNEQAPPWFVMLNEVKHLARVSTRLSPLIGL